MGEGGSGKRYRVKTGDVSGQVVVGEDNVVVAATGGAEGAPAAVGADLESLRSGFAALRGRIDREAEDGTGAAARERIDELEEAVTADKPEVSVMVYVRDWFVKRLPALAGAVTALIVHPFVGRLVEHAGDAVASEFSRHFGDEDGGDGTAPGAE
ncbi:hypothetical protein O4J56_15805 [Nocardiopsis sp. RSe5-2]|uniref:Uncharacterized protein n=1 Tax=Nocardiopsis endophytica TaxID=3018445 RepID=A0ABT4U581_9ACTN|nr:hypothetical protein [Nocardiopsis endophytica]MDA2812109.1 hypothetical protein [Nocardiopsis endophytica]